MPSTKTIQILRISALLAVIFASGILVGRYTKPEPEHVLIEPSSHGTRVENAVEIMSQRFGFGAEKEAGFQELMERMDREMNVYPPLSEERREVWRRHLPEMRSFIPEDKMQAFEDQVKRTERRLQRAMTRRNMEERRATEESGPEPGPSSE